MTATLAVPASSQPLPQHIVLDDVSWELYEQLLRQVGKGNLRMTYDQGRLEIMSPLPKHERPKRLIGRLIEELSPGPLPEDADQDGRNAHPPLFSRLGAPTRVGAAHVIHHI